MELSIIIVNWNTSALLKKCLESIYNNPANFELEIIVVDNNSSDDSQVMVKEDFPQVRLISNNKNQGFARGNNQGLEVAQGDYILLLNPDTEIFPQGLEKIINFIKDHSEISLLGCQLLNPDGSLQESVRNFPSLTSQLAILFKFFHFWPNFPPLQRYLVKNFDYKKTQEVDQIMGAFMLMPRVTIEKYGLLDKGYFYWFEEVDYCKRIKAGGGQVVYTPAISIKHLRGQSFKQVLTFKKQLVFYSSMLRYFKKHHSWYSYLILVLVFPLVIIIAWLAQLFKFK